jgi:hypothetical protein
LGGGVDLTTEVVEQTRGFRTNENKHPLAGYFACMQGAARDDKSCGKMGNDTIV